MFLRIIIMAVLFSTLKFAQQQMKEVTVSTAKELLEALDSDTRVTLKEGVYNISAVTEAQTKPGVMFINEYEVPYLFLEGLQNLEIVTYEGAEIVTDDEFSAVLDFSNCSMITLFGLTMGHTKPAVCFAAVLRFAGCSDISVLECDLYGSGDVGVSIEESSNMLFENCVIRECSSELLYMYGARKIDFIKCDFRKTDGYVGVEMAGFTESVNFDRCRFYKNSAAESMPLISIEDTGSEIYFSQCIFEQNKAYELITSNPYLTMENNKYIDNEFVHEYQYEYEE